jgi:hypothetical protein
VDAELAGKAAEVNLGEARSELGGRGFDYLSAGRQTLMLNDALQELEDYWEWPWLRKTATGPAPLQVTDLKTVLKVTDQAGNELTGISDYDDFDPAGTGTPANWWIDDTDGTPTLIAVPVGDITLTVRYERDNTALADTGDTPDIPARYNRVWLDLAVALAYEDSDNFSAAAQIRARARQRLDDLVARYETRDMQTSPQRGTRSWSLDD